MEEFRIRKQIDNGGVIELSNQNPKAIIIYLLIALVPVIGTILLKKMPLLNQGMAFYSLALLILLIVFYLLVFSGSTRLSSDKVYIDKVIGKKFIIDINELKGVSFLNFGKIKLTTLSFMNDDFLDKVMIINTRSTFKEYDKDPEQILKYIRRMKIIANENKVIEK